MNHTYNFSCPWSWSTVEAHLLEGEPPVVVVLRVVGHIGAVHDVVELVVRPQPPPEVLRQQENGGLVSQNLTGIHCPSTEDTDT
jgi:hypothetical protein